MAWKEILKEDPQELDKAAKKVGIFLGQEAAKYNQTLWDFGHHWNEIVIDKDDEVYDAFKLYHEKDAEELLEALKLFFYHKTSYKSENGIFTITEAYTKRGRK